jgi:hypothetical protein
MELERGTDLPQVRCTFGLMSAVHAAAKRRNQQRGKHPHDSQNNKQLDQRECP